MPHLLCALYLVIFNQLTQAAYPPMQTLLSGSLILQYISASLCLASVGSSCASAATRYLSLSGSDNADGTTPASAWRSITKLNANAAAGDLILFKGGETFDGGIYFGQGVGGTAAQAIIISSYDPATGNELVEGADPSTRATIRNLNNSAFVAFDSGGYVLRNLNFVGPGQAVATEDGLKFFVGSGNAREIGLEINQVNVSGFTNGISVGGWGSSGSIPFGYDGVVITSTNAYENSLAGIFLYGEKLNTHQGAIIRDCVAYDNEGDASATVNTGNGILMNGVTDGLIEHCIAYSNGAIGYGSVGIWTYGVDGVTIQYCESYNNKASSTSDGGGFDFDGGTINSLMQYNYSHGNDGAGFLLAQYSGATEEYGPLENNVIRYNISENDARRRSYGGLMVWGANSSNRVGPNLIYGNTIHMDRQTTDGTPSCIRFLGSNFRGLKFYNNLLVATGGAKVVNADSSMPLTTAQLLNNNYFTTSNSTFRLEWGSSTHDSTTAWLASASAQERADGVILAKSVDPLLTDPGQGGTIGDTTQLASLTAYTLTQSSPMLNSGLDLTQSPYLISVGTRDFYGNSVPSGSGFDIGAHERLLSQDSDGDGVPDAYEILYGSDPAVSDAAWDQLDGDGIPLLLEYAFGLSPSVQDGEPLEFDLATGAIVKRGRPILGRGEVNGEIVHSIMFLRLKDQSAGSLVYTPLFSDDLQSWTAVNEAATVVAQDEMTELLKVDFSSSMTSQPKGFTRILVAPGL